MLSLLVDTNLCQNMTSSRAASLGVRCVKLPLSRLAYRASVLNVDVVLNLLLQLWQHPQPGSDAAWQRAIEIAMPPRRLACQVQFSCLYLCTVSPIMTPC
jgi:hypothetical protein